MKNPFDSIQSLSHAKALIFAFLILGTCLFASFLINIPASSITKITAILNEAGFQDVKIGELDYNGNGVQASSVTLDPYGFDKIAHLDIGLSWPSFIFGGKVKEIKVTGLTLSRKAADMRPVLQRTLTNLLDLPDYRLVLEETMVDLGTPVGDLRFVINATIDPPDKDGQKKITASVLANQYQLGFDSRWSGALDKEGKLDLAADIVDGKIHFGPLDITRFNGWISLGAGKQALSLQSQLNAGGAEIFDVPMQDVSLVSDASQAGSTIMFRSSMAGLKDVTLSSDLALSADGETFDITLKGDNMGEFFKRIAAERKNSTKIPEVLAKQASFRAVAAYQADRRFESGPLPFSLEGTSDSGKIISGNFLIYPEEMDIRGSAEIDPAMTKAMQSFFDINTDKLDKNFIRLDGDFESLFKPPVS